MARRPLFLDGGADGLHVGAGGVELHRLASEPGRLWQRYLVIVASGFIVTLVLYHCLVRPFTIMRRALGLPAKQMSEA